MKSTKTMVIRAGKGRTKISMGMTEEYFLSHLFVRLLSKEAEKKAQIYEEVADLKLVYYVDLTELFHRSVCREDEMVSRKMIHIFCSEEMDEEFIFPFLRITALQNMYQNFDFSFWTMTDTLPVYVLTMRAKDGERHSDAPALILHPNMDGMIRKHKEFTDGYLIIPSSVHELLVIPKLPDPDTKKLARQLWEIYQIDLSSEDALSDGFYTMEEGTLVRVEM